MSDTEDTTPEPQTPPELPSQDVPNDTSNWDDRVFTDPSGDTYINSPDEQDIITK